MGLDSVELVMEFEEAFGIGIPDAIASQMITPRDTINYIESTLGITPVTRCLTQQTFYRLRRGLRCVLDKDVADSPATAIRELSSRREWPSLWSRIREVAGDPNWPEGVPWKAWLIEGPRTLRELTLYVAMHLPAPDLERGESWTRQRIELMVRRIVWEQLRVPDFKLDDQYVRDMGFD